ncbi:hypothetical protein NDU88_005660 [Pleurodeles waltl]|uniref:Uncharacterized protein n=1 Tax=Pleurodeles waltl TaxID=8319 RepID=A0AAV7VMB7_PLEWA|nr:hypothetical protein NDU88_005660 [Pleurodeles waltl]
MMCTGLELGLASSEFRSRIQETSIEPRALADHAPVSVTVHLGLSRAWGPGWRFCGTSLQSKDMADAVRRAIRDYLDQNDNGLTSLETLWEALKEVIRGGDIHLG